MFLEGTKEKGVHDNRPTLHDKNLKSSELAINVKCGGRSQQVTTSGEEEVGTCILLWKWMMMGMVHFQLVESSSSSSSSRSRIL